MKLTGEGRRLIFAAFLITLTALNTGNNLIYLVLSLLLSVLVVSVFILANNMRKLVLSARQDKPVYANTPAEITLILKNMKGLYARSVKVSASGGINKDVYFSSVPPYGEVTDKAKVLFKKRGIFKYGDFQLESGYPFIFFIKKTVCPVEGEIVVYPEIKEIREILQYYPKNGSGRAVQRTGSGDDFSTVREFRYGDDSRRIHWKASAKTDKLLVMEYDAVEVRKITIILDNLAVDDKNSFEKAVSFAASVSDHYIKQGYYARLLSCTKVVPFGSGQEQLFKILDVLAVIEGKVSWECPMKFTPEGITFLVLNSRNSALNNLVSSADMVFYAQDL